MSGRRAGPACPEECASVFSWERATNGFLDALRLNSIKVRILLFALLATLIPSLTMGWLSYRNNRRAIDEKVVQELASLTSHASREINLWIRERRYELRILASSYEVSENLAKLSRSDQTSQNKAIALRRMQDYLESIGKKFADYRELFAVDARGHVVASSAGTVGAAEQASGWLDQARSNETIAVDAAWDETLHDGVMLVVEPIRSAEGALLGALGAKVGFDEIEKMLAGYTKEPSQEIYLVTRRGVILTSSRKVDGPFMGARLDVATTDSLFSHETAPIEFHSFRGDEVLGALRAVPEMEWGVVAEKDRATAYAAIIRMRNITLSLISTILLGIGLAAYLLGLTIARPLGRLTQGAAKVAAGDLEVDLPIHGRSEVSYTTTVFNDMVARLRRLRDENAAINQELRERNEELRRISITDGLTGLYNRTQLPEFLEKEMSRSRRHQHPFSILMIDIDHFKRYNDAHGHQAGDDLLRHFATVLRATVRSCDLAVRYGGEEFLILLTETEAEGASNFAEKLRAAVEEIRLHGDSAVTISIGVASFPDHGDDVDTIIHEADAALYACKRQGRNRVAVARTGRRPGDMAKVSSG
jgi:diguanylate cyclase (GGDEF)-like protein